MIFDSHCHLGYGDTDAELTHAHAIEAGVTHLLDVGCDLPSSRQAASHAARLAGVWFTAGIHPNEVTTAADSPTRKADWQALVELLRDPKCVAVGETGLDFYWDRTPKPLQVEWFERQLALAIELDYPVVIHARDAFPLAFEVLAGFPRARGVFHCFSGGVPEAERALALDFHLSFAGPLTYRRSDALRAAAAFAPTNRILIETDAPFLPPQSRRGQTNQPAHIVETLTELARVRGTDFELLAIATSANAMKLFDRTQLTS